MKRVLVAGFTAIGLSTPAEALTSRPLWESTAEQVRETPADEAYLSAAPPSLDTPPGAGGVILLSLPAWVPAAGLRVSGKAPEMGEAEIGSLGCVVGGTASVAAALAIGGLNVSNLIAGGLVPAANPGALYAALVGVVFATFCAVGQSLTPIAIYAYHRYVGPPPAAPMLRDPDGPPVLGGVRRTAAAAVTPK